MSEGQYWRCSRRSCKWVGTEAEKGLRYDGLGLNTMVCPLCRGDSFYCAKPKEVERHLKAKSYAVK